MGTNQQFAHTPPIERVSAVFTAATGCPFITGSTWSAWRTVAPSSLEPFRTYIRPCHQRLLDRAIASPARIASFLRQILRVHEFTIESDTYKGPWALTKMGERVPVVLMEPQRVVLFEP